MNDEQTRTTADLEQEEESANFNEKPDLRNVDYNKLNSENSEVRRQQLDNIAEAALEFQPRGYTLETTEVRFYFIEKSGSLIAFEIVHLIKI